MVKINTRRMFGAVAGLASIALIAAGCAAAPSDSASSKKTDFLPCMVSDAGGFDDHSFNQLGYEGLQEAAQALGSDYKAVQSKDETEYASNIDGLVSEGCNLIITVGFNLSAATVTAALANPNIEFAIIDDAADNNNDGKTDAPNIKPILFNTAQAAFLGGYAAASYTKTGVVGTFGGMNYPTVSIFMDGFAQGVDYYNSVKGTSVKVVGWTRSPGNPTGGNGVFTGGFEAGTAALTAAQGLISQNADVILPVGGPIYESAQSAIEDANKAGKSIVMMGVDADMTLTDPTTTDILLTSIMKQIDVATEKVVEDAGNGNFDPTAYVGTLDNGGVGLAPFHNFESKVSSTLQSELDSIKADIISGKISVESYLANK